MSMKTITLLDRIHGCLLGIAAGDALGMSALSTLEQTIALHGSKITTFIDAATDPTNINIGGDCDTLGAIAGGLTGALHGVNGFPPFFNTQVEAANNFGLRQLSEQFLAATQGINGA